MKILTRIVVPVLGALLLAGCAGTKADGQMGTNMVCVISGEPVDADSPKADFMGQEVRFCCKRCKGKWDGMDEAARKAKVAAMK